MAKSDPFMFDSIAPIGGITINSGDKFTNSTGVTLQLSGDDSDLGEMCISNTNNEDCSGKWQPFAESTGRYLEGGEDGSKTVYVRFKDDSNNESQEPYTASIILDRISPTVGFEPDGGTNITTTEVTVTDTSP
jgi:hypothetical protein